MSRSFSGRLLTLPRFWQALLIIALVGGSLWVWHSRIHPDAHIMIPPSPRMDAPPPPFSAPLLDGDTFNLDDYTGHVVVINLWATWCPPCRAEMPALERVWQRYERDGLMVVAINQGESVETVAAFRDDYDLTFPIVLDTDGTLGRLYQLDAYPTSFFVGRDGVIREVVYGGPMPEGLINSTVRDLLEE